LWMCSYDKNLWAYFYRPVAGVCTVEEYGIIIIMIMSDRDDLQQS